MKDAQKHVCNRLYKPNHSIQESSCHLDNLKPHVHHRRIVQNDRTESHKPYNVQLVFDDPLLTMELVIPQSPRCVQQQDETDYLYVHISKIQMGLPFYLPPVTCARSSSFLAAVSAPPVAISKVHNSSSSPSKPVLASAYSILLISWNSVG